MLSKTAQKFYAISGLLLSLVPVIVLLILLGGERAETASILIVGISIGVASTCLAHYSGNQWPK